MGSDPSLQERKCDDQELEASARIRGAVRDRWPLAHAPRFRAGTGQTAEEDVLRIGWAQDPKNLNPFVGVNEEEFTIWAINWELLINCDPKDLTPAPGIAESWDVSEDGKTITFNLVKGAKWSDGEPITSADVKFSLETLGEDALLFTGYTSNVTADQDARRRDGRARAEEAGRPHDRRPLRLHPARAHLGEGVGRRSHRRLPARDPDGRKRPLHRHRVQARPDPPHGGQPGVARRGARLRGASVHPLRSRKTPSSAPSPSARSTSSRRSSRRPSSASESRRGSRRSTRPPTPSPRWPSTSARRRTARTPSSTLRSRT